MSAVDWATLGIVCLIGFMIGWFFLGEDDDE